ncbi:MAG TPA: translation initiation factor IF-2 N-terminal domain-containing protein, partial [Verrucomicrobiae bacterium]|nr:translation initiation factor IF-2 N-terminal domain-containing protein [Verrucomicrobiae bacterium]
MPVRIYDISKKLGLENKVILAKAKSLGIAAAKVPSSSLDKISAEFLEEELFKEHPEVAAKFAQPPAVEKPKA